MVVQCNELSEWHSVDSFHSSFRIFSKQKNAVGRVCVHVTSSSLIDNQCTCNLKSDDAHDFLWVTPVVRYIHCDTSVRCAIFEMFDLSENRRFHCVCFRPTQINAPNEWTFDWKFHLLLFFTIASTGFAGRIWIGIVVHVASFTRRQPSIAIVHHWLWQRRNSPQYLILTYVKIVQHFSRIRIIYI